MKPTEPDQTGRKTISVEEAGKQFGISRETLTRSREEGREIPTIKMGACCECR